MDRYLKTDSESRQNQHKAYLGLYGARNSRMSRNMTRLSNLQP